MGKKINVRLVLAVFSTLLEEILLVGAVFWGLPHLGIQLPLAGIIALMVALGVYAVFSYRIVSRSLRKKPVVGLPTMIGSKGKVASPLDPEGLVRIKGELWGSTSAEGNVGKGEEVEVVGEDGLKLMVRKVGPKKPTS